MFHRFISFPNQCSAMVDLAKFKNTVDISEGVGSLYFQEGVKRLCIKKCTVAVPRKMSLLDYHDSQFASPTLFESTILFDVACLKCLKDVCI